MGYVLTELPDGCQETPDFRLPQHLFKTWRENRILRSQLHHWRLEFDEAYKDTWEQKRMNKGVRREGWEYALDKAKQLEKELEESGAPQSRILLVVGIQAQLQDKHMGAEKKQKAVQHLTDVMRAWEEEQEVEEISDDTVREEERDRAKEARTLDLIRVLGRGDG